MVKRNTQAQKENQKTNGDLYSFMKRKMHKCIAINQNSCLREYHLKNNIVSAKNNHCIDITFSSSWRLKK